MFRHHTLSKQRPDAGLDHMWDRIDRRVVLLATGAAVCFFVLLMITWVASGEHQFLVQSLAPVAVGLIYHVSLNGIDQPGDPIIALLAMAIAAAALARKNVWVVVGVTSVLLAIALDMATSQITND